MLGAIGVATFHLISLVDLSIFCFLIFIFYDSPSCSRTTQLDA